MLHQRNHQNNEKAGPLSSGSVIQYAILGVVSALSLGAYIFYSARLNGAGFPLDDAWIHQTYARNLAQFNEWSFMRGEPSGGSTAPLWSGVLAVGDKLGINPYLWTFFLGWLFLWLTGVTGEKIYRLLLPNVSIVTNNEEDQRLNPVGNFFATIPWAGLFLVLEWHLAWAAGSGMETLFFTWIILCMIYVLTKETRCLSSDRKWMVYLIGWCGLGALVGVSTWLRPDGITFLGPIEVSIVLCKGQKRAKIASSLVTLFGFMLLFFPYLAFNYLLAGAWWPNTYYAKQAEYAIYQTLPFWKRLLAQAGLPLVGGGALLLPGFGLIAYRLYKQHSWTTLTAMIWVVGYLALYAWRLPVTYQHGRYVIPAMTVFFIWGLAGMSIQVRENMIGFGRRVFYRTWIFSTTIVLVVFWSLGGLAYSRDVAVINGEMVAAARWIAENTQPGALIAAHDIGALGYFGNRELIDLAGLVTPEVIPFIRDEQAIVTYLNDRQADYLVTFPGWYPEIVDRLEVIYQTPDYPNSPSPREPFVVFRWFSP
jgi:hypothetical protein